MPAINFGGLASGLDTEAIITALVDAARRPITLLEAKKAT
jgi:flagellar capping protein FliD